MMKTSILTGIHSVGSQQLVGVLDGLRDVYAAIGESIDGIPLVQIGTVSVKREVVVLIIMANTVELFDKWDTGPF